MVRTRILLAVAVFALAGFVGGVLLEAGPLGLRSAAVWKQKKKIDEEEDDAPKPKGKKITPIDEETPAPPTPSETVDLAQAARDAKHKEVKALFQKLVVPSDRIELKKTNVKISGDVTLSGVVRVEPLPEFFTVKDLKGQFSADVILSSGKKVPDVRFAPGLIVEIRYYEQFAIAEVKDFLALQLDRGDKANARFLEKYDQYVAAEAALSAVLRWHQSAWERKIRKGEGWSEVEEQVRDYLLTVLLARLDLLIKAKSWDPAFELTRHLTETFRRPKEHARIAKPVGELLTGALGDSNYTQDRLKEVRQRLRHFESQFPNSDIIKPISDSLRDQAKALFDKARELFKEGKKTEALAMLREAEDTWPELPGLRTYHRKAEGEHQVLRVGMRQQPRYLSPAWAATESERRAVDLLFESLVTLAPDDRGMMFYRPGLAEGRFQVIPLGRQFRLPRHARWSDGRQMTANDITFSIAELQQGRSTGRASDWGALLVKGRVEGDAHRVKVLMHQGYIDPLALMSFKVVPERMKPHPDSEDFAKKPITSGPFEFAGTSSDNGRLYTGFVSNPHYGARAGRQGKPRLREVRFFTSADPAKDLKEGRINLALDLTAEQAAALQKDGYEVPMPSDTTVNRRIYFLAVNNSKGALKNADLRIALARAINREALLDKHFREGLERQVHKALNGPYPARSWACNPKLAKDEKGLDPHDEPMAKTKAKEAFAKLGFKEVSLTLKYPSGDKALAEAMTDLCARVSSVLPNVKLTAEERDPHDLRVEVEQTHEYQLAYWHYDFPDETFWLMPLLGPGGKNGENLLSYNGKLVSRIQSATNLRHFADVRKQAHAIHQQHLEVEMPFIPLWQLDPLYAHKKGKLDMPAFDANRIFARIEEWAMK